MDQEFSSRVRRQECVKQDKNAKQDRIGLKALHPLHLEESCIHAFQGETGCQVTLNSDADISDDIRNFIKSQGLFNLEMLGRHF
ncbi:hypothetical protein H5410_023110 [Solanum commersonii]|uniref:Uncharacterized protein n=1 Tax=Solanum commersonii TaxID=4109 RepID=A0A9J5ZHC6_SOLCO|nr:hypothetical protein H5410_023110 [Solanum commersonii]